MRWSLGFGGRAGCVEVAAAGRLVLLGSGGFEGLDGFALRFARCALCTVTAIATLAAVTAIAVARTALARLLFGR